MRNAYVYREESKLTVTKMNHPAVVSDFLKRIYAGLKNGYEEFDVFFDCNSIFPNACVPIAGIIQYYVNEVGIKFKHEYSIGCKDYLTNCGFVNPISSTKQELENELNPFGKIYKFESPIQVGSLTNAFINSISRTIQCNDGVIDCLIWCINEVMDNVLIHSGNSMGYIMGQIHPSNKHVAFCIFDSGIGIYNSLKESKHRPAKHLDAITMAIQEGVGDGLGQGNGLYGLQQIVNQNIGRLTITSGPASLMMSGQQMKTFSEIPFLSKEKNCTTVDFQIDLNKEISIQNALGGYTPFDARIDDMLMDNDMLLYDVYENCMGTATRMSGEYIRNDVFNLLRRNKQGIVLDFSNVSTVSSSFIDEFIAKLMLELGTISFNQIVRVRGMKDTVKYLCERSIYMRFHETWEEKKQRV